MENLKNRLDTLVDIHNRIQNQKVSCEVDIMLFNRNLIFPEIPEQAVAHCKQEIASRQSQIEMCNAIISIIAEMMKTELGKKERKESN